MVVNNYFLKTNNHSRASMCMLWLTLFGVKCCAVKCVIFLNWYRGNIKDKHADINIYIYTVTNYCETCIFR